MQTASILAFLKGLPWKWIIIGIVVIFILYKAYRWWKDKQDAKNYTASVNQSQTALNQLAQQGVVPSYGQAQYTTIANTIEQAMEGCGAGFDETLKPAFQKMKNDADVYALIKAYGVRTVDKCGILNGDLTADLAATLAYKFSGVEDYLQDGSIAKINKILADNSITFSF